MTIGETTGAMIDDITRTAEGIAAVSADNMATVATAVTADIVTTNVRRPTIEEMKTGSRRSDILIIFLIYFFSTMLLFV